MEKRLREISRFFVAPRREFAPVVRARPRTPFSIITSTSVHRILALQPEEWPQVISVLMSLCNISIWRWADNLFSMYQCTRKKF